MSEPQTKPESKKPANGPAVAVGVDRFLLSTDKLVKAYNQRRVVDGVSVGVEAGQIVGLLGPNGAGKTTTFNMVVGIVKPDQGTVQYETHNITTLPMEQVHGNVNIASEGNGQAKGSATIRSGPNTPAVAKEFVVWNRTMYTKGPDGKYVSMGPAEKIYDPAVILDKDKGLANIIGKVQNPVQAGTENINGIPTVKITGTIDAAVIDVVVPQLGKDGGTLPVTLYIADTSAPATSAVPTPAQPYLVQLGVKKDPGNVRITMSDWGKPYTIEDPTK